MQQADGMVVLPLPPTSVLLSDLCLATCGITAASNGIAVAQVVPAGQAIDRRKRGSSGHWQRVGGLLSVIQVGSASEGGWGARGGSGKKRMPGGL